jgi:hypothetical protein
MRRSPWILLLSCSLGCAGDNDKGKEPTDDTELSDTETIDSEADDSEPVEDTEAAPASLAGPWTVSQFAGATCGFTLMDGSVLTINADGAGWEVLIGEGEVVLPAARDCTLAEGAFACPSSEYGLTVPTGPDTVQTLEGSISVLGTFDGVSTLDVTSWDSRQSAPSSCSEVATFVLVR